MTNLLFSYKVQGIWHTVDPWVSGSNPLLFCLLNYTQIHHVLISISFVLQECPNFLNRDHEKDFSRAFLRRFLVIYFQANFFCLKSCHNPYLLPLGTFWMTGSGFESNIRRTKIKSIFNAFWGNSDVTKLADLRLAT